MEIPKLIMGGSSADHRGSISFFNDFKMDAVKRFYVIKHPNTETIRAWRGHKIEQRWFYVSSGMFEIKVVKIDDWIKPSKALEQISYKLNSDDAQLLHIPAGYATSLQALKENSEVIVFADYGLEHAEHDNYLFPSDYFR